MPSPAALPLLAAALAGLALMRRKAAVRQGRGTVGAAEDAALQHPEDGEAHPAATHFADAILTPPEGQTSVMLPVGIKGCIYRETADILGIPVGTAMSRMSRARQILAAGLEVMRHEKMT